MGSVFGILQDLHRISRLEHARNEQLNAYMKERRLPRELQHRLRKHFRYAWRRVTSMPEEEHSLLQQLPPPLRERVLRTVHKSTLESSPLKPLLARWEREAKGIFSLLLDMLRPLFFSQHELIVEQGTPATCVFFLLSGRAIVSLAFRRSQEVSPWVCLRYACAMPARCTTFVVPAERGVRVRVRGAGGKS
jgi:hypothetical protein